MKETAVTEREIERQLRRMLRVLTPGSILSSLADLIDADAEQARRAGDGLVEERCRLAAAALVVVGHGLDATLPR